MFSKCKNDFFDRWPSVRSRVTAFVMRGRRRGRFFGAALVGGVLSAATFLAQNVYADATFTVPNPIQGATTITDVLTKIVNYLNLIVDPLIVLMVLWGGLQILMGGADEAKFKEGRNTIKYAAIGAIVIICASGLVYLVAEVMKVSLP